MKYLVAFIVFLGVYMIVNHGAQYILEYYEDSYSDRLWNGIASILGVMSSIGAYLAFENLDNHEI